VEGAQGRSCVWILGTVSPLRRDDWQSDAVQDGPAGHAGGGARVAGRRHRRDPFTALRLYIQWRRFRRPRIACGCGKCSPAAVRALLGPQVPIRANDERLEELRPMLAAERLLEKVLDASGLTLHNEVQQSVPQTRQKTGCQDPPGQGLKDRRPCRCLKDVGASRARVRSPAGAIVTRLERIWARCRCAPEPGRLVTSIRCADCLIRTTAARALPLSRARSASESLSHGPRRTG